jgi:integrase
MRLVYEIEKEILQKLNTLIEKIDILTQRGRSLAWPRTTASQAILAGYSVPMTADILPKFEAFVKIDLRLSRRTVEGHVANARRFIEWLGGQDVTCDLIREYLKQFDSLSLSTYANHLKTLKVFLRDFLKQPSLVESFRFPHFPFQPSKFVHTKIQIREFYSHIESLREKALFLFFATSGLRKSEVLDLEVSNVNFTTRMITPKPHDGRTKFSYLSFYNRETERVLRKYLAARKYDGTKLFPMRTDDTKCLWKTTRTTTKLRITPKVLRDWFCDEMGRLGVADRYIDAFCGRVPKSVLANNYTDFSSERLKEVYNKASLSVLT